MQTNSRECLEHAELYLKRAAEVTDPVLKKSLIVAAERWKRLAAEFESGNEWAGTPANFLASVPSAEEGAGCLDDVRG